MIVTLSCFQLSTLILLAERRNCVKQIHGVKNRRISSHSDFSINYHGLMAEFAVGKQLGVKVDDSVTLHGDDKIADLVCEGKTIQVKTKIGANGRCLVHAKRLDAYKADIIVQCTVVNATDVVLNGWVTRQQFSERAALFPMRVEQVYGILAEELNPFEDLVKYLKPSPWTGYATNQKGAQN